MRLSRILLVVFVLLAAGLACGPNSPASMSTPVKALSPTPAVIPTSPANPTSQSTQSSEPPGTMHLPMIDSPASTFYPAMRPGFEADVDGFAAGTRYALALDLTTNPVRVEGVETVRYLNDTGSTLDDVIFRLYPNALTGGASLTVESVIVQDQSISTSLEVGDSVLRVPLPESLAPGDAITMQLTFNLTLPENELIGYGRMGSSEHGAVLSSFLPLLSVYQEGGWWVEPPVDIGDPVYSATSLFDVSLRAPSDLKVAASGTTTETTTSRDGLTEYRIVTGPMRDFSLSVSPEFELLEGREGDINVHIWSLPGDADADRAGLDMTQESLRIFNEQFGDYPYRELDVVEAPLSGAAGIEYPGLYYTGSEEWNASDSFFEIVAVHETAHQWWYSLVGNDQVGEPWLDESLAQYSVQVYFRERYGDQAGSDVQKNYQNVLTQYLENNNPQEAIDLPVVAYHEREYVIWVYYAGPLFYSQLEEKYGAQAVSEYLQAYFSTYRYQIVHTEDVRALLVESLGDGAGVFFDQWIENKQ